MYFSSEIVDPLKRIQAEKYQTNRRKAPVSEILQLVAVKMLEQPQRLPSAFFSSCIFLELLLNLRHFSLRIIGFNPLQPGVAYLYPLKTSENLKVFLCFRVIDKQHWAVMG